MATFIDMTNPVARSGVQLAALVSALRLEVNTGMKMSRSVNTLEAANRIMGTNFKRKKAALEAAEKFYADFKEENGIA